MLLFLSIFYTDWIKNESTRASDQIQSPRINSETPSHYRIKNRFTPQVMILSATLVSCVLYRCKTKQLAQSQFRSPLTSRISVYVRNLALILQPRTQDFIVKFILPESYAERVYCTVAGF